MKKKHLIYIIAIVFVLSLIPMYIIGLYDHPSVDDYFYGTETAAVWQSTASLKAVFSESFKQMVTTYNEWQGNFAAIFLMRLQPGIFGEGNYVWAPVLLITTFVAAMLTFFYVFLRKWFNSGKTASIGCTLAITFCAIQFTHVPSDSFYWYNGSIYYTFFFSLMLLLFTLTTIIARGDKTAAKVAAIIIALPLAFIIGGGNYATALFTVLVLAVITVIYIIKKRKTSILVGAITICAMAGLLISMIAPGNAIRQESVGGSSGVIKALVYSFAYGGYNIASSTTAPVIVLWLVLLPVFYRIAKNSRFSFKYPLLVLLFTFGLYCSQGTPVLYAQGLRIPYRMMNIIYFSYYIFMTFNLIYFMGWLSRRKSDTGFVKFLNSIYDNTKKRTCCIISAVMIFAVGCIGLCTVTEGENGNAEFSELPLSVSATISLINGDAGTYDRECTDRAEYLSITDEQIIELAPLSVRPEVIFHTDITEDPAHWKNMHLAKYYNKVSIRLSAQ